MRPRLMILLAAVTVAALTVTILPASADPTIHVEELTRTDGTSVRGTFTDDVDVQVRLRLPGAPGSDVLNLGNPSSMAVARLVVEPGARFPWHTHPGPVLVSVVSGDLVYVNADDCVERPYPAGTAFVDPGRGNVHTAFNEGDEDTVLVATFLDAGATGPLTITEGITAPEDCDSGPAS